MKSKFTIGSPADQAWQEGFKAGRHTRNILMIDEKLMWEHFANSDGDLKGNKITDLLDKTMLQVAINLFLDKSHQSEENGLVPYNESMFPLAEIQRICNVGLSQALKIKDLICSKFGQPKELIPLPDISELYSIWQSETKNPCLTDFFKYLSNKFGTKHPEVSPKIEGGYFGTHCHICTMLIKDCMCAKQRKVLSASELKEIARQALEKECACSIPHKKIRIICDAIFQRLNK